jgi:adenylate cyclase
MMKKFLSFLGPFVILSISAFSMLLFQFQRDVELSTLDPGVKHLLKYPSFLEDRFYDLRMLTTLPKNKKSDSMVLAAIDDHSLKELGRFPWSRETFADITRALKDFGARGVVWDVVMSEPERTIASQKDPERSPDQLLVDETIQFQGQDDQHFVIFPFSLTSMHAGEDDISFKEVPAELYDYMLDVKQAGSLGPLPYRVMSTTFPIPAILSAKPSLSFIGGREDADGLFRRYPLLAQSEGLYFPSMALQSFMLYTGKRPTVEINESGDTEVLIDKEKIYLNLYGETKVRWPGDTNMFPRVGLGHILDKKMDEKKKNDIEKMIKDKIVFIGATAFAAHDLRHTPVDAKMPGVFFHMAVTQMLLEQHFFKLTQDSLTYSWILLLIGAFFVVALSFLNNPIVDLTAMIALSALFFVGDLYYFIPKGYEITLFFILLSVVGIYAWQTFINFYFANQDKKFLKSAFGNYISPELIDEMYESGEAPKLGGDCGVRTAFFTDIQGFSTFSEKLGAVKLVELLNEYLTVMTDLLIAERGTLDKYEGDAIIAFFGAPMPLPDHATRAIRVACQMQEQLLLLRKKWQSEGDKWPQIVHDMRMRIGVNSGEIVTGNMGSKMRMNYTMMGDSVNLAARLEEAAKQYGIFTHVAQFALDLAEKELFLFREIDTIRVVGKTEPVTTFEILGETSKVSEIEKNLVSIFAIGLKHYKNQAWDLAIASFEQSLLLENERFPELKEKTNPSKVYLERCLEFKKLPPPPNWDGVYTLTHK